MLRSGARTRRSPRGSMGRWRTEGDKARSPVRGRWRKNTLRTMASAKQQTINANSAPPMSAEVMGRARQRKTTRASRSTAARAGAGSLPTAIAAIVATGAGTHLPGQSGSTFESMPGAVTRRMTARRGPGRDRPWVRPRRCSLRVMKAVHQQPDVAALLENRAPRSSRRSGVTGTTSVIGRPPLRAGCARASRA